MGFSFRKSFKIGPARINVSKSGVGASIGVKGARIGVNAKGNAYVSAGAHGIYYRKTISGSGNASAPAGQTIQYGSGSYDVPEKTAPAYSGGVKFRGNGKTVYWRYSAGQRAGIIVLGVITLIAGLLMLGLTFAFSSESGSPAGFFGFGTAVLMICTAGLFAVQSKTVILDDSD